MSATIYAHARAKIMRREDERYQRAMFMRYARDMFMRSARYLHHAREKR